MNTVVHRSTYIVIFYCRIILLLKYFDLLHNWCIVFSTREWCALPNARRISSFSLFDSPTVMAYPWIGKREIKRFLSECKANWIARRLRLGNSNRYESSWMGMLINDRKSKSRKKPKPWRKNAAKGLININR